MCAWMGKGMPAASPARSIIRAMPILPNAGYRRSGVKKKPRRIGAWSRSERGARITERGP
jgi:hypothetical protein